MILSETNYKEQINNEVMGVLSKVKEEGYFEGEKNVQIYYVKYININSSKVVVISHGFAENLDKYIEMIYYFYCKGYSVYALEHRGFGRSTHLGKDISQCHLDKFDYYLKDFDKFIKEIVEPEIANKDMILFGHSMGGLISLSYVEKYEHKFSRLVLSSPFTSLKYGEATHLAEFIVCLMAKLGFSKKYVPGHASYKVEHDLKKAHTSSRERYDYSRSTYDRDERFQLSGASYGWVEQCVKAYKDALKPERLHSIKIDVLLCSATMDSLVDIETHNYIEKNIEKCRHIVYEGAKHEVYEEKNEILEKHLEDIFNFLDASEK